MKNASAYSYIPYPPGALRIWEMVASPLPSPPPSHHRFLSNETKLRETAHADISKPPAIVTQHRSPHARA